jgi:hypothetical protein
VVHAEALKARRHRGLPEPDHKRAYGT